MQLSYPDVSQADIVAEAHIERRSEEMFFSLVQVRAVPTGRLVAMGNVSYRLLEAVTEWLTSAAWPLRGLPNPQGSFVSGLDPFSDMLLLESRWRMRARPFPPSV